MGHLQRCLSLATALYDFDVDCLFLANKEPAALNRITHFGFDGHTLEGARSWGVDDLTQTIAMGVAHKCNAIIVDSDCEGNEYLSRLRNAGFFVCAIEDTAPHPFACQLVVNGDAHARQLLYQSSSGDTSFLLGPEYAVLRREFWEVLPRVVRNVTENILVTLGGSDRYNLMPRILRMLDDLPGNFTVKAIIGPFFGDLAEVKSVAGHAKHPVTLVQSPNSVLALMLEADVAVSAGGQTLYELACVGCPTVAIRLASNQDGQLEVFAKAGFVRAVGHAEDKGVVATMGSLVLSLLGDSKSRALMASAGQRLVDGQGAMRVAKAIVEKSNRLEDSDATFGVGINRTNRTG